MVCNCIYDMNLISVNIAVSDFRAMMEFEQTVL